MILAYRCVFDVGIYLVTGVVTPVYTTGGKGGG